MTHQLDNISFIVSRLGSDAAIRSVQGLAAQMTATIETTRSLAYPSTYMRYDNIVFCGMGGSRFPGLIVYHLYKNVLRIPFTICDDYSLPGFVNQNTLVVLSSYSGTTEEVLACAKQAHERSACIVGFCVGGPLQRWLESHHYPFATFNEQHNPSKQPRMGFGYTIGSTLGILLALNAFRGSSEDYLDNMRRDLGNVERFDAWYGIHCPFKENPAKKFASEIEHKYPYFLVAEHLVGVGNCVQNQANETSKGIASFRVIPELNHHMMEGLQFPAEHKSVAVFVSFLSGLYDERIRRRFEITHDVIKQNEIQVLSHKLRAETHLGQVLELLIFSSYMTIYTAALRGVKPENVPYVDYFKAQLKKSS